METKVADTGMVEGKAVRVQERYDVPGFPGAWVELRRWTHGESTRRTDQSMSLVVQQGSDRPEVVVSTQKSRQFDFRVCIVDHNISFDGKKADFKNPATVDGLDPVLGEAIATLISNHNTVVDDIPKSD